MKKPNVLVISEGGVNGFCHLGALVIFEDAGLLSEVTSYVGTSVGAIICYLLAIGYTVAEIMTVAFATDYGIENVAHNIAKFTDKYGLISKENIIKNLRLLTEGKKISADVTLLELYEREGKRLICVAGNVTTSTAVYFDYFTHPTVKCLDIIAAGFTIPSIFDKTVIDNHLYVDGALVDPFPVTYLDDGKNEILGITINSQNNEDITGIFNYMYRSLYVAINQIKHLKIEKASEKCTILDINISRGILGDTINNLSKRMEIMFIGFHAAREFLKKHDEKN